MDAPDVGGHVRRGCEQHHLVKDVPVHDMVGRVGPR